MQTGYLKAKACRGYCLLSHRAPDRGETAGSARCRSEVTGAGLLDDLSHGIVAREMPACVGSTVGHHPRVRVSPEGSRAKIIGARPYAPERSPIEKAHGLDRVMLRGLGGEEGSAAQYVTTRWSLPHGGKSVLSPRRPCQQHHERLPDLVSACNGPSLGSVLVTYEAALIQDVDRDRVGFVDAADDSSFAGSPRHNPTI